MLTNGFPYNPLRPLKRIRLREARGTRWLMGFFSSRVLRGGPRLLAYLTGCLVLSFLALRFVSQELSQAAVGTSRAVWHWHTGETWDATSIRIDQENALGYGEDGLGNLRIVVFGEQDIATPSWRDETAPSWTDVLCQQLHCSTYLSFVPGRKNQERSMVSIGLYAQALDEVAKHTAEATGLGEDYSFQAEKYPVAWEFPDLDQQITAFLAMDKPKTPPRETLWVFTLGTWDVWSLASLPSEFGQYMIGQFTEYIFDQVERLYESSLNQSSVAWSDVHGALVNPSIEARKMRTDMFRILVPKLFDPSLTPAWSTERPDLGEAHPKAEQLRTATILANEWNREMFNKLESWVKGPDVDEDVGGRDKLAQEQKDALEKEKEADAKDTANEILGHHAVGDAVRGDSAAKVSRSPETVPRRRKRSAAPKSRRLAEGDSPKRDGFLYNLPEYLIEAIRERQLRHGGQRDGNGRGGRPVGEGYQDVWAPCSAAMSQRLCNMMQEHLFATPFTVAERAIKDIGEIAALQVLNNETVRARWDRSR